MTITRRGLAGVIALFAVLWTGRAWFAYSASVLVDGMPTGSWPSDIAAEFAAAHEKIMVAAIVFGAGAIVAAVCAVAVFFGRAWAKFVWLAWTGLMLVIYMLSIASDSGGWSGRNLELLFAAPLFWFLFRLYERRHGVAP